MSGDSEKTELDINKNDLLDSCPYCGIALPIGAITCTGCGASLYGKAGDGQISRASLCPCCNKIVAANCDYCPVCGVRLKHGAGERGVDEFAASLPSWSLEPQFDIIAVNAANGKPIQ